jgi:Fe-S cluster assembly protein SufD
VDAAQLFYMMSRGIDERTAMKLLVFGFFEEIIEQTANEELAAGLRQFIQEKFESKI